MASIRRRTVGGKVRYQVRWRQGGVRNRKEVSEIFAAEKDAIQFRGAVDAAGQQYPPGWVPGYGYVKPRDSLTHAEWFPRAIAARTRASVRTRADYQRDFDRHVPQWLADRLVSEISREDAGLWVHELRLFRDRRGKPLSPKTISNVHGVVSSAMNDAITDGLATRNPFAKQLRGADARAAAKRDFMTPDEVAAIVCVMHPHYRDFVQMLYDTGMRLGEAVALAPSQLDLKAATLLIDRAWKRDIKGGYVGPPKSAPSRRVITLADSTIRLMTPRLTGDPLFVNRAGTRITHGNFYTKFWKPAVVASGIGRIPRVHDLRHSHAALLISKGVPLVAVCRRLGHASISVTADIYSHLLPEVADGTRAVIDSVSQPDEEGSD